MDWIGLALAVLKLVNLFVTWGREKQLMDAGRDQQIAEQAALILGKTNAAKKVMEKVHALSSDETDELLRSLEPGYVPAPKPHG